MATLDEPIIPITLNKYVIAKKIKNAISIFESCLTFLRFVRSLNASNAETEEHKKLAISTAEAAEIFSWPLGLLVTWVGSTLMIFFLRGLPATEALGSYLGTGPGGGFKN